MLRFILLLFFVFASSTVIPHNEAASTKKSKYEALRKQKEQEKLQAAQDGPTASEQAAMEAELREQLGGQAALDAAKKKLADYVESVGGEEGLKARVEKIGHEAVQREIQVAVHGIPQETFMLQLGLWVGLLLLLALPITRNEIVSVLTTLQELFAVDRRGILCFRVWLGVVVALDAFQRISESTALYSELGVFPRELAFEEQGDLSWSLYFANGHIFWTNFLLGVTALAGLSMAVGFRSRVSCLVAWVLVSSIHVRNPAVCNAGDVLLRISLLWASFLPLSDLLSVDNYIANLYRVAVATVTTTTITDVAATTTATTTLDSLSDNRANLVPDVNEKEVVVTGTTTIVAPPFTVGSLAAVGLLFQLVLYYFFTGTNQEGPGWSLKENYSAFYYLLSAPSLTHPSADNIVKLAHDPQWSVPVLKALRFATLGTILLERWGVLLLLVAPLLCLISYNLRGLRDAIRSVILLALAVLNVALILTLKLGPLPLVLLAIQTLFVPSWVFNVLARLTPPLSANLMLAWRLHTSVGVAAVSTHGNTVAVFTQPVYLHPRSWPGRLFCVFLLAHTVWLNFADSGLYSHEIVQDILGHQQAWGMFPEQIDMDSYLVISAKLRGRSEPFDMQQAFGRREVKVGFFPLVHLDSVRPTLAAPFYDSFRWTSFMVSDDNPSHVRRLAAYICREWNKVNHGPDTLETLEFYNVAVRVKQPKQPLTGVKKSVEGAERFFEHSCSH